MSDNYHCFSQNRCVSHEESVESEVGTGVITVYDNSMIKRAIQTAHTR